MKTRSPFREPARVEFHLDHGYTRILLTRTKGIGMANGGIYWDIPTEIIPFHLRTIGSQLLVIAPRFTPEEHDSPDDIRRMRDQIEIHQLTGHDRLTET